jgi:hypothetical protein
MKLDKMNELEKRKMEEARVKKTASIIQNKLTDFM